MRTDKKNKEKEVDRGFEKSQVVSICYEKKSKKATRRNFISSQQEEGLSSTS